MCAQMARKVLSQTYSRRSALLVSADPALEDLVRAMADCLFVGSGDCQTQNMKEVFVDIRTRDALCASRDHRRALSDHAGRRDSFALPKTMETQSRIMSNEESGR